MGNTTEPFALKKRDYCGTHHMYFEQRVGCGICNRLVQDAHERERGAAPSPASTYTIRPAGVRIDQPIAPPMTPLTIPQARITRLRAVLGEIVEMTSDAALDVLPVKQIVMLIHESAREALDVDDQQ